MAACCKADRLPMIAPCRAHHAGAVWLALAQRFEVDEAAAQLEGAYLGVVLVLDPGSGAEPLAEERPTVLRRGGLHGMHRGERGGEGVGGEHVNPVQGDA